MNKRLALDADETLLRRCLEGIVAERFGRHSSIADVRRERIRYIGSYDCETISIRLADGEELKLFWKDYGFSRRSKDDQEGRRKRELGVYRDIFAGTKLGPPEYYGSVWDESEGRYWLFLELVKGTIIKDHNVDQGVLAAGWLGRMQGALLRQPGILNGHDFSIHHDASYFRSKAERALRDVAAIAPDLSPRFTKLVDGYDQAIQVMIAQPLTLVHGAYIPWHIILDLSREPVRVCPVDWESAALGASLYDLAIFTDGVTPQIRNRFCDAYRAAAEQSGVWVPERPQIHYVMGCFRLHRIFDWLSRSVEKRFSKDKVAKLVSQAERLGELIIA